jgi:hypothetical protein
MNSSKNNTLKFTTLSNDEMRAICGGKTNKVQAATFPCTVREADGTTHTKEVSSVEECLKYGGLN